MGRLTRFLRRVVQLVTESRGVTMYETVAVVAMTGVLAAVAIPMAMDSIENSKLSKTGQEVLTVGSAVQKFFEHTGRWPGEVEIRKAGSIACFLQTGIPTTDPAKGTLLPEVTNLGTSTKVFDATEFLGRPCNTVTAANTLNINNYLVQKPNAADYPNWNGPYMEPLAGDSWDRGYIINVLPLIFATEITGPAPASGQFADLGGKLGFGWILSAGPDRLLQTALTQPQLSPGSDDTGKNLGARIVKSAGGQNTQSQ